MAFCALKLPFLDKEIMNLASKIPTKYKISNGTTKYVLRRAASNHLPDKWALKDKLGFPTPIREWLKEEKYFNMVYEVFNSENATKFFVTKNINKLLEEHKNNKADNSRKIWCIYSFLIWYQEYFKN